MQKLLENLNPPSECLDCDSLKCVEHDVTVDTYASGICEALDQAVSTCLPLVGQPLWQGGQQVIPGWTEYVKPYQDESLFWNGVWRAAGCPEVGELYEINRQAKMQYKYAVRRLKRAAHNINVCEKFASLDQLKFSTNVDISKSKTLSWILIIFARYL